MSKNTKKPKNGQSNSAFPASEKKTVKALDRASQGPKSAPRDSARGNGLSLSDPACRYLAALTNPRDLFEAPCIPAGFALPSYKFKCFARGAFNTGTTGYGFCAVNMNLSSTGATVQTSTSTTVMTPTTALSLATNLVTATINSPFAASAFAASNGPLDVDGRLVGAALYVRFADTELNRGGDVLLMEEPLHNDVTTYSYNTAMNLDPTKRKDNLRDWQHVCISPKQAEELDYWDGLANGTVSANPQFAAGNNAYVAAVFVNTAGASRAMEYEYYAWVEVLGGPPRGQTESYVDPVGFACIINAVNLTGQLDSTSIKNVKTNLLHATSYALSHFGGPELRGRRDKRNNFTGLASFLPMIMPFVAPLIKNLFQQGSDRISNELNNRMS